ncbi:hypothetical protein [Candidatus Viadribacter manganicus]|uniref:DUF2975 domain-containing protein n=1 Tax=Candidatus Viadribacter manganicus TaxID=1759059 RepID=A0A1B1AEY4_9PROT|nr:hypothetical protein [Candidatus Viadribacter manganicus]ANP45107.1 hypothetical protein ATE48_03825 [Candidatus Viadribacter manganicus]
MSNVEIRVQKARAQAGQMRVMGAVLMPMLAAAIGLPLIGEVYLVTFEPAPWAVEVGPLSAVLIKLLSYAPAVAAAVAVAMLQPVLVEYHDGRFVSEKASAAFQLAGTCALVAFFLKLLVGPLAIALLGGAPFAWRFDPLDIALMVFSASVMMIGGVLDAAVASLKAENDEIV